MTTLTQKTNRVAEAQGNLIDQFKNHTNIDAVVEAFATQDQELEDAAFEVNTETTLANSVGQQIDNLGTIVGVERGGRTDAEYLLRIAAQILLNKISGSIPEIVELAEALGLTNFTFVEAFPAKIEITEDAVITEGEEIGNTLARSKAGGVGFAFTWYESATPFKFDTAGQGFDLGELGDMVAT